MYVFGIVLFAAMAIVCVVAFFKQRRRRIDEAPVGEAAVVVHEAKFTESGDGARVAGRPAGSMAVPSPVISLTSRRALML